MLAALSRKHIAQAGRLGELESDTSSPCGLLVPTEGHEPLAHGRPSARPEDRYWDSLMSRPEPACSGRAFIG